MPSIKSASSKRSRRRTPDRRLVAGAWFAPPAPGRVPSWFAFRGTLLWSGRSPALVNLGADSKYWLYVNGDLVVREGGLKRGPSPGATYIDELDLSEYLHRGANSIAVRLCYFGREGFSHQDSGSPGLYVDGRAEGLRFGRVWRCRREEAFYDAGTMRAGAFCGYRLPEHSIGYDARRSLGDWTSPTFDDQDWGKARRAGAAGCAPWGELVLRPIPQFSWGDAVAFSRWKTRPGLSGGRILAGRLPFNRQFVPWVRLKAAPGLKVEFHSDSPTHVLMAEYLTTDGEQEWESPGWMSGHELHMHLPADAELIAWGYRPTGYDCGLVGSFKSSDVVLNDLWLRAARTLLITMRDTFMDCPCRERAQWWGDEVIQLGQAFYCLDERGHALVTKGVRELAAWQRPDDVLCSPVPAGNWGRELPAQMLASIGRYGFWTYYWNTGDAETIRQVFPAVKRYLALWGPDAKGFARERAGDWTWGDWGTQIDLPVIDNAWLYLAWEGAARMAELVGDTQAARHWRSCMARMGQGFRRRFWREGAFRSPGHEGPPDDRANALAVLAGLHRPGDVAALMRVFRDSEFASPYMEKYVLEAMFELGETVEALRRMRKRFRGMLATGSTTLWEKFPSECRHNNTNNHSWSGGPLTLLYRYVGGVEVVEPGQKRFRLAPQPGDLKSFEMVLYTPRGSLRTSFRRGTKGRGHYDIRAPKDVPIDWDVSGLVPDHARVWLNGRCINRQLSGHFSGGRLHVEWKP
jgi:alpha-L-rhamnosidase